jgi:GTP-binding protein LepA
MMRLAEERRGVYKSTEYLGPHRVVLVYDLPLAEVLYDFYDRLKSLTRGFGTMDYEFVGFRPGDLVRLDIMVNGQRVDALSTVCHRDEAFGRGKRACEQLGREIPRQQFAVPIQAAIAGRIVARETIRAVRKNVTAKCYGGDITRKRKLLERQREGKRRMKSVGNVEIPQSAFLSILNVREPSAGRGRGAS